MKEGVFWLRVITFTFCSDGHLDMAIRLMCCSYVIHEDHNTDPSTLTDCHVGVSFPIITAFLSRQLRSFGFARQFSVRHFKMGAREETSPSFALT